MSDYTPTTEHVRQNYFDCVAQPRVFYNEEDAEQYGIGFYAEFDRWLAEVKAEAWEEGAQAGHWVHTTGANPYRQQT